jgi:hypothetical protein
MGRYADAADALQKTPPGIYPPAIVEAAARLLRTPSSHAAAPESLPRLGLLSFVYLYAGAPGRALEPVEDSRPGGVWNALPLMYLWHSSVASFRKTERFKAFARKAGLLDYWRAKGWPDLCHPVGADDFACN